MNTTKFTIYALSLALLLMFFVPAQAQTQQNVNDQGSLFFKHPLKTLYSYTNSQTDTLPQPSNASATKTLASPAYVRCGGASMVTITVYHADSMRTDFYVDQRIHGSGSSGWSNILTDSVSSTSSGYNEFTLRTQNATEILTGLDKEIRIRLGYYATGNGTAGGVATKKATIVINWKQ